MCGHFVYFITATVADKKDMPLDFLKIKTHFIPHQEENTFFFQSKTFTKIINFLNFILKNNAHTKPLHMLITDTADRYLNSSTYCFAKLSIFGNCISKYTHKRF